MSITFLRLTLDSKPPSEPCSSAHDYFEPILYTLNDWNDRLLHSLFESQASGAALKLDLLNFRRPSERPVTVGVVGTCVWSTTKTKISHSWTKRLTGPKPLVT